MTKRNPDLTAMRRTLIMAMWVDYKLFGYTTEEVKYLQKRIIKARQGSKVIQFPNGKKVKRAA